MGWLTRWFRRGNSGPWRSQLRPGDVLGVGTVGLRTRKARAAFTALGIAIGIASMVAVLGISSSSRADLLAQLDRLGTNLLAVQPGEDTFGEQVVLRDEAPAMVRRIAPVQAAAAVSTIEGTVQRSDKVASSEVNGISIRAVEHQIFGTLGAEVASGRVLDRASAELPTVVLGSVAAERLGITDAETGQRIWIKGQWFTVIGVLESMPLHPDLDRTVMIGIPAARSELGEKASPGTVFLRAHPDAVNDVRGVLARTVEPGSPNEVQVSRPSDALAARAEVDRNLQTLLVGLGGVALLVGGVGIANVMVISVLERRGEIGVRRALGATRRHIRNQFVVESSLLSLLGGVLGVALGFAVTTVYAQSQGWVVALPMQGLALGVGAALIIGALAGLYPAVRAARLDPAEAVRPAA